MKNWIPINIHNVNIDAVVEFHIISQCEPESAWGSSVLLAVHAVLGELSKNLVINIIIASTFQYAL
jgi:hypothetical protein